MQKSPTDRNCFGRRVQKVTCQIINENLKRKRDSQYLGAKETLCGDKWQQIRCMERLEIRCFRQFKNELYIIFYKELFEHAILTLFALLRNRAL